MSLCALDQEFSSLRGIIDDPTCSERDRTAAAWRWGDVIGAINTTEPDSIGDCVVKLRSLLDRGLGMSVGDRPDDRVALRQVAEFLEDLR
jgi:hypothetical protein